MQAADRQQPEQIAGEPGRERRSDRFEILAFRDELRLVGFRSIAIVIEHAGFVVHAAEVAEHHHAAIAAGRERGRAERAIREVEVADAGVLLETERHLEAAALDPERIEGGPFEVDVFPVAELNRVFGR